jgi:hypothetical protein
MAKNEKEGENCELQHKADGSGRPEISGSDDDPHSAGSPQDQDLFGPRVEGPGSVSTVTDKLFGIVGTSIIHRSAGEEIKNDLINLRFYAQSMVMTLNNLINTLETVQKYDDERSNRKV